MGRWVLHVDLDQFIAAVEVLRRPELRGRPVVVGGDGDPTKRGVVATASYEARAFGVHSGLPLRTAVRRCPEAVFLPADRAAYEEASARVMATLKEFDAVVEVIGWDEAFLGVVTEDPEALARQISLRVLQATQLSCAIGIGQNKLQAKTATGFAKPSASVQALADHELSGDTPAGIGTFRITAENWFQIMGGRPTDSLWGIGSRTARKLAELGINTVTELAAADDDGLAARFGPTIGPWLGRIGRGQDSSSVIGDPYVARSRSREVTFQQDLADWDQVRAELAAVARLVADDVAKDGRPVFRISVKVRWVPFTTQLKVHKLAAPVSGAEAIEAAALDLLEAFDSRRKVRLLGVRAEFT